MSVPDLTAGALRKLGIDVPAEVESDAKLVRPEVKVHTGFRHQGYTTRLTFAWEVVSSS